MTTVRQLYDLQELDLEIGQCQSRIDSIDGQLSDRLGLDATREKLEAQRASLSQLRLQQRAQTLEADSLREKVQETEGKLYSGTVTNLRELEGFELEAAYLRGQLGNLDDRLLETMVALEEGQERVRSLENEIRQAKKQWQSTQADLAEERPRLEDKLKALEAQRCGLVSRVSQPELKIYEDLRLSKGGSPIAKVERGMCRGCRMALPTHQLQRARMGRELVRCSTCGRILLIN